MCELCVVVNSPVLHHISSLECNMHLSVIYIFFTPDLFLT